MTAEFDDCLIITGPTGSGKSSLAMDLAEGLNAEIIGMDSMTLYRGMDIGTAKPTVEDRRRVPHHLIDVRDPWESASVAWWREQALAAVTDIRSRGRVPLFVGGTPFYLMAVLYGIFEGPPADETIRQRLDAEDLVTLYRRLQEIDPVACTHIHVNDRRRIVRALEVYETTGRPISSFQTTWNSASFGNETQASRVKAVRIDWPRETLYARIDRRVHDMVTGGWRDECERLLKLPNALSREAEKAIGYREWFQDIRQPGSIDDVEPLIAMRTRQFAKRQLTWFRRLTMIPTVRGDDQDVKEQILNAFGV